MSCSTTCSKILLHRAVIPLALGPEETQSTGIYLFALAHLQLALHGPDILACKTVACLVYLVPGWGQDHVRGAGPLL